MDSTGFSFGGFNYETIKYTEGSVAALPPTIVDQPQSLTVLAGTDASFFTLVSGTTPIALQWLFNGAALPGATNSYLDLAAVRGADAGDYRLLASNQFGSATSIVAHLSVQLTLPTITGQPQTQTALEGEDVSFYVTADGALPLTYRWTFNGTNLIDGTDSGLTLRNVQFANSGNYQAVVSNLYGSATSSIARLTVQRNPTPPASRFSRKA